MLSLLEEAAELSPDDSLELLLAVLELLLAALELLLAALELLLAALELPPELAGAEEADDEDAEEDDEAGAELCDGSESELSDCSATLGSDDSSANAMKLCGTILYCMTMASARKNARNTRFLRFILFFFIDYLLSKIIFIIIRQKSCLVGFETDNCCFASYIIAMTASKNASKNQ